MSKANSYIYEASDVITFKSIAEFALKSGGTITVNPTNRSVIVIGDATDDDPNKFMESAIDSDELNVKITRIGEPATDTSDIISVLKQDLEYYKSEFNSYRKYYNEAICENDRIKKQIASIGTLVEAIAR